ncbi:MAG TPA: serine/threonine-protein kinase, partial [Myxococcota bacterium]|nr:serine/threonine-protein kinase [Myxococcota bacterium]
MSGDFSPAPTAETSAGTDDFDLPEPSRYVRGALLGVGGMGRVVAAQDLRLGRMVALKEALPGNEARLAREAKITAILDHPGIVPVHDAGRSADGRAWYVMRLVRGRSLAEAIAGAGDLQGRLRLLRHLLHACQAMAYAHSLGVIHRDIKPDNILVGEFGETQVMDWGLARQGQLPELPPVGEQPLGTQTLAGSLLGTPAYMSPEQARGEEVGPVADIWSLGAVLYEILVGKPPFFGENPRVALEQLRRGQVPSLRDRVPEAPPELVAVLERAMAPLAKDRYPSAKLLAEDLASYLDGRPVAAYRYSPKELLLRLLRAWRLPLTVAGVALVLLVGSLTVSGLRILAERDRAQLAEAHTAAALAASDRHLAEALLQQAFHAQEAGTRAEAEIFALRSLLLRDSPEARGILAGYAAAPRPRLLASTPLPTCEKTVISPRGDQVLCLREGKLHQRAGEKVLQQWELPVTDMAWVGERVFAMGADPRVVVEMRADGSTTSLDIPMGQVVFSGGPVGTLLPLGRVEELGAVDVATGLPKSWGRAPSTVLQRAISPDGRRMAA